jgi:hypothetical protein
MASHHTESQPASMYMVLRFVDWHVHLSALQVPIAPWHLKRRKANQVVGGGRIKFGAF